METELQQWMTTIGVFISPLVAIWIGLGNRQRNVKQAQESRDAIHGVGEKVNVVEAKVEGVENKVTDVSSQVDTVSSNVAGHLGVMTEMVKAIDPAIAAEAAAKVLATAVEAAKPMAPR